MVIELRPPGKQGQSHWTSAGVRPVPRAGKNYLALQTKTVKTQKIRLLKYGIIFEKPKFFKTLELMLCRRESSILLSSMLG